MGGVGGLLSIGGVGAVKYVFGQDGEVLSGTDDADQCPNPNEAIKNKDLSGINCAGKDMHDITIEGSNLKDADLKNANLKKSYMNNVKLNNANLSKVNMEKTGIWKTGMSNTDLQNAKLRDIGTHKVL